MKMAKVVAGRDVPSANDNHPELNQTWKSKLSTPVVLTIGAAMGAMAALRAGPVETLFRMNERRLSASPLSAFNDRF